MLRGASGGYTILEVTIVLAISFVILGSAMLAIQGSNGRTQFAQSMRDVNSKLLSWIGDVNHGLARTANAGYNCQLDGSSRPLIYSNSDVLHPPTQNPDCIYLGKVIQFTVATDSCASCVPSVAKQSNNLYAYTVFGRRTMDAAGTITDSLANANPVPAVGQANASANAGPIDLTETYTMGGGTTIKSITSSTTPATGSTRLLGITQSFNANAASANGAQDLFIYSNLANSSPPGNINGGSAVTDCIELKAGGSDCLSPPTLNNLMICFQSAYDNARTALITITSGTVLGAQTKLEFKSC